MFNLNFRSYSLFRFVFYQTILFMILPALRGSNNETAAEPTESNIFCNGVEGI